MENAAENRDGQVKHIEEKDLSFKIPDCVGKNIRHLRQEKHMTQKQLATAIGCEPSFISHIERVSRSISIRHLFQIADAMHTTPAALVTDGANQLAHCLELLERLDAQGLTQAKEWLEQLTQQPSQRDAA